MDGRELRRSWWVGLTLVPLALTGWAAFLYAGVRGAKRVWTAFGFFYLALTATGYVLAQYPSTGDFAGAVIIVTWCATFGHALVIRSDANLRIDARASPALREAEQRRMERERARTIAERDPRRARELGIGRPDRPGFSGGLVDLNSAPIGVIVGLPGVTPGLARRIVEMREELGGFSSLNDLGQVLSLDATTIDRLRSDVVVLPWD